jgi:hypothetical protein
MKKRLLFLFIGGMIFFQGNAQEVPEVQNTLLTKITATWCTFCGSWGWDAFNDIYNQNLEKAIIISNHYSGDLRNNTAIAFADNFNTFGQPLFYVNNTNQFFTSSNRTSKADDVKKQVDDNFKTSPIANTGIIASLDGNNLTIQTKTKFFKATAGEYYLGIYAIENGVVNFQQSRSASAVHKNVLRGAIGTEAFGKVVANGNITEGTEINLEYIGNFSAAWNPDATTLATIIWKKEGDSYQYVNGYVHNNWQSTTSTEDQEIKGLSVLVKSSLTNDFVAMQLNLDKEISNVQFSVFDLQGKMMERRIYSQLSSGLHEEIWNVQAYSPGTYFLHLNAEEGVVTKKIVVQR